MPIKYRLLVILFEQGVSLTQSVIEFDLLSERNNAVSQINTAFCNEKRISVKIVAL